MLKRRRPSNLAEQTLKYRSRFDIVGEMLQSAVSGATKTRLMYDAFLSHSQVEEYLGFLLSKGLIAMSADKKHYLPTEKGIRFLSMYGKIKDEVALNKTQSIPPPEGPESLDNHGIDEVVQPPSPNRKGHT